jgi:thioredoxin-related protein
MPFIPSLARGLLALALCVTAARADPPAGYPFVGHDAGLAQAKAENRPVMLYFGRYGCAWCDHVNRKTFSDAGLKQLLSENYMLIYVDAEGGKRLRMPNGERLTAGVRQFTTKNPHFSPEAPVSARVDARIF